MSMTMICPECLTPVQVYHGVRKEREEMGKLADRYGMEQHVRFEDGTICDLMSETHAFEVDYPYKWAEAVGQSLHYAMMAEKKPGIILLLTTPATEWQHVMRCARLCGKLDIKLHVERVEE